MEICTEWVGMYSVEYYYNYLVCHTTAFSVRLGG